MYKGNHPVIRANTICDRKIELVWQCKAYVGWSLILALFLILTHPISACADYAWPVDVQSSSYGFADYNKISNQKYHTGIDLSGARKTTVVAA